MNSINLFASIAIFASGAAFGFVASNSPIAAQQVQAEAPPPAQSKPLDPGGVGRYRIDAFSNSPSAWGCYRIDTQTGDTWMSSNGGKFRRISN